MSKSDIENIKTLLLNPSIDENRKGIELFETLYATEEGFLSLLLRFGDTFKVDEITDLRKVIEFFKGKGTYASHDWFFMKLVQYGTSSSMLICSTQTLIAGNQ